MDPDTTPVATVTGLYRGTFSGLEPLTKETPLTLDEVRRNPVFYELDLCPDLADADLIIDIIYDNMNPVRLQDLFRGTDIPRGIRFWPDWFEIPPYREIRDINHRMIYPRAPEFTRSDSVPHCGRPASGDGGGTSARPTVATPARHLSSKLLRRSNETRRTRKGSSLC
jgi:hypothetical protein